MDMLAWRLIASLLVRQSARGEFASWMLLAEQAFDALGHNLINHCILYSRNPPKLVR